MATIAPSFALSSVENIASPDVEQQVEPMYEAGDFRALTPFNQALIGTEEEPGRLPFNERTGFFEFRLGLKYGVEQLSPIAVAWIMHAFPDHFISRFWPDNLTKERPTDADAWNLLAYAHAHGWQMDEEHRKIWLPYIDDLVRGEIRHAEEERERRTRSAAALAAYQQTMAAQNKQE